MYDTKKLEALFDRAYNNVMINDEATGVSDEKDIKEFCQKVFGDGSETPDPSLLHQFNNILVKQADAIAKPMATNLLNYFATYQPMNKGDLYSYNIPQKVKAKFKWSATGSGVDLVRVEKGKKVIAVPQTFQTGFYYEPTDMVTDSVENFRKVVNDLAEAKIRLYIDKVRELVVSAVSSGSIPSRNVLSGANTTIANFNKVGSAISRVGNGGQALFVGDTLLIDYYANLQTVASATSLYSDKTKDEFLNGLSITQIGRTKCVNLLNPYTDDTNSATELSVQEGYMFSSAVGAKPFVIAEYGGMRQVTEQDPEDERIKMVVKQDASIELIYGNAIGFIKETSVVL